MIAIHPALLLVSMLWAEPAHGPQTSLEWLPRSSIAAVLARSRELGLTPDQVKRLEHDRAKGGDHAPASAADRATELRGKLNDADTAA